MVGAAARYVYAFRLLHFVGMREVVNALARSRRRSDQQGCSRDSSGRQGIAWMTLPVDLPNGM